MTGYQRKGKTHLNLLNKIEESMLNSNKIDFVQTSLVGALDVYKKDTQVSMNYSEREFYTIFDSRRQIIKGTESKGVLLDTKPFLNKDYCKSFRSLMTGVKNTHYHLYDSKNLLNPIKTTLSLCERMFVRAALENKLGVQIDNLGGLQVIVDLLIKADNLINKKVYKKVDYYIKLIACLKRKGSFVSKAVPFNEVSEKFVVFVKSFIKGFDVNEFLEVCPKHLDLL